MLFFLLAFLPAAVLWLRLRPIVLLTRLITMHLLWCGLLLVRLLHRLRLPYRGFRLALWLGLPNGGLRLV